MLSWRKSEAETMNSRRESASLARTSSARPVARTLARSDCSAVVLSASKPSGKIRPTTRRAASPKSGPAAGLASMTLRLTASTTSTASALI